MPSSAFAPPGVAGRGRAARGGTRGHTRQPALVPAARADRGATAGRQGARAAYLRSAADGGAASARTFPQSGRGHGSSAVDAARLLRQPRAAGMINALLRRYLRERAALLAHRVAGCSEAAAPIRPGCSAALRDSWPEHWQQIVAANNEHPPMSLRVDLSRSTREATAATGRSTAWRPARCRGWTRRWCWNRRCRSSAAAGIRRGPGVGSGCRGTAGRQLLLACAARGARARCLRGPWGQDRWRCSRPLDGAIALTAWTSMPRTHRAHRQNLRGCVAAPPGHADLRSDLSWWDGVRFDRILLDAPCSAPACIRRHPDIKLLRRARRHRRSRHAALTAAAVPEAAQAGRAAAVLDLLGAAGRKRAGRRGCAGLQPRARCVLPMPKGPGPWLPGEAPWQLRQPGVQLLAGGCRRRPMASIMLA
jgi:hypothetical protein